MTISLAPGVMLILAAFGARLGQPIGPDRALAGG